MLANFLGTYERISNTVTPERIEYCTKRPTIVFFLSPTKPLPPYDNQARAGDTGLVKSTEMTGRIP